jgi:hypothetical protein
MNHNDSFEAETICGTELQNGENLLNVTSRTYRGSIFERQQMLDLQMPSFIRGDEDEDATGLFLFRNLIFKI